MLDKDRKRINLVDVDDETHKWLVREANKVGMSIRGYAGYLLENARAAWEPPTEGEPERLALWNYHCALGKKNLHDLAYRMAALYEYNPTEEMAERLAEQCELAGLDYREVMQRVADDPFSSLIAFSHNGTKLGECIRWLSKFLAGKQSGLPARVLLSLGERRGYGETMMNRAKRAMNNDPESPRIISIRMAQGWYWKLEEREGSLEST